jgi:hypothetical protein
MQERKNHELNLRAQALDPPTDAPYYIPLSIHIVRKSDGTGGLALKQLYRAMEDLNRIWQPVGVQFFIYRSIDYINDDVYFNLPGGDSKANVAARDALRLTNPFPHTINVYFTNIDGLCGESTRSNRSIQGVLMSINCTGIEDDPSTEDDNEYNPSSFAHEIGHYFDLFHTHESWKDKTGKPTKVECPDGSNCAVAGDLICDTPADPDLSDKVDNNCNYTGSDPVPSGCRGVYNPLTNNLMSYSDKPCRTQFTSDQIKVVLYCLRNQRPNLITSGARYVDPLASPSNEECTYNSPCQLIRKAVEVAQDGDFIFIKPAYNHVSKNSPLGGKRVTLMRWGTTGEVNITN